MIKNFLKKYTSILLFVCVNVLCALVFTMISTLGEGVVFAMMYGIILIYSVLYSILFHKLITKDL